MTRLPRPAPTAPTPTSPTAFYPLPTNYYPLGGRKPWRINKLPATPCGSRICVEKVQGPMISKNREGRGASEFHRKLETRDPRRHGSGRRKGKSRLSVLRASFAPGRGRRNFGLTPRVSPGERQFSAQQAAAR